MLSSKVLYVHVDARTGERFRCGFCLVFGFSDAVVVGIIEGGWGFGSKKKIEYQRREKENSDKRVE